MRGGLLLRVARVVVRTGALPFGRASFMRGGLAWMADAPAYWRARVLFGDRRHDCRGGGR